MLSAPFPYMQDSVHWKIIIKIIIRIVSIMCVGFLLARALCRECNAKEKARGTGKYVCHKCQ